MVIFKYKSVVWHTYVVMPFNLLYYFR